MSSSDLRVVFDISVLGLGMRNPLARTGVFRTIENLLDGFLENQEVSLSLYCGEQQKDATLEYLDQKGLLTGKKAAGGKIQSAFREYGERWFNRGGILLDNTIRLYPGKYVNTQVFHSPWFPIPASYGEGRKVRNFLTVHDLIPVLFPEYFTPANVSQFKKNLECITPDTWVICNSNSTRSDLLNYCKKIDPEKVSVTYWAASSLFRQINDEQQIGHAKMKYRLPDGPYLLTLATVEPRKNIRTLLASFRRIIYQEKIRDLNLVLAGTKGWKYREIIDDINSDRELSSRVFFTGYMDDADLAGIYSGSLAFVYPSFYEGFGLPPLEAMQCGVPVICSNTSSMPEVVGDAGILIDPEDAEALAESILKVYSDPDLRGKLSRRSLQQSTKFSWNTCLDQTIVNYRKSLQR
jgi:glycosyltransferase involved in cell wall biosynthesis